MKKQSWTIVVAAVLLTAVLAWAQPPELNMETGGTKVTEQGKLEIDIAENFSPDGAITEVREFYYLNQQGRRIRLSQGSMTGKLRHGSEVRVTGSLSENQKFLYVEQMVPVSEASQEAAMLSVTNPALGEQRTLVALVNFLNDPSEPATPSQISWNILDEANPSSSASYIQEVSYGRAWLSGEVQGWFPMDYEDPDCQTWYITRNNENGGIAGQLIPSLDPYIDFTLYDRMILVIPYNANCGFLGISSLGKMTFSTDEGTVEMSRIVLNGISTYQDFIAAHELGHSLAGLQHSHDYECGSVEIDDNCNASSYSDNYDIMGYVYNGGHFSSPNKEYLGWLDAAEIEEVVPPGGEYTLYQYETTAPGTKVLKIEAEYLINDLSHSTSYFLSYRKPIGFDAVFSELNEDGLMIHIDKVYFYDGDQYPERTQLLDMTPHVNATSGEQASDSRDVILRVGQTFSDQKLGITITPLSVDTDSIHLSVDVVQYCGNGAVDTALDEECDGANLDGRNCESLGFLDGGTLACSPECHFDTTGCSGPVCGPGHQYNGDGTCSASILADLQDAMAWTSASIWADARGASTARNVHDYNDFCWLYIMSRRDLNGKSWIYRTSFPFDTSSIPDSAALLSAGMSTVVLPFGITNTHPDFDDSLVLVNPSLSAPPTLQTDDFDQFGSLDSPVEGAPRVDVSQEAQLNAPINFILNQNGMNWVDTQGWTLLGLRTGYDVENTYFENEDMELNMYLRSSCSPITGPRLDVTYLTCTDDDGDGYSCEGSVCGPADCICDDAAVNPGATEVCDDGIDNDCDGNIDCGPVCADYTKRNECNNDPACEWVMDFQNHYCRDVCTITEDPEVSCSDEADNDCDGDTDGDDQDCCVPTGQSDDNCDAIDDDCDGTPDDNYIPTSTNCGVGQCAASGQLECQGGVEVDTCTPGTPAADDSLCNGLDDDCDGSADEDYVVDASCGIGECLTGNSPSSCVAGVENACTPGTPAADDSLCNGLDDDCDGSADEDYVVDASCGIGECLTGNSPSSCVAGVENACTPGTPAADDSLCNGLDDDCDGSADEDYVVDASCGIGECLTGNSPSSCVAGVENACTPGTPAADDSLCNGLDDDCDGSADEDYVVDASCGIGECLTGNSPSSCVAGVENACTPGTPATEVWYDGIDQNCDGWNDYDQDMDTYVDAAWNSEAGGTSPNIGDCDDTNPDVYPGGPPVKVIGATESYYLKFQVAYNAASDLDKIQTKADTLPDDVDFNHNISIEVNAGYNCDYSTNTGVTIIEGNMTVSDGTVTIQSGTLQVQ